MSNFPQARHNSQPPAVNPLKAHFRQPAAYLTLPSRGDHWAPGSLEMPEDGKIPVFPMTVQNEITLKMPDALLSGGAVVEIIQSCCPHIKNAWAMPSVDVDATLMTIRIASYGDKMTVDTQCPECKTEGTYDIPLYNLLDNIKYTDYEKVYDIQGLKFKFKPQDYRMISDINNVNFEETRLFQSLENSKDEEERQKFLEKHLKTLVDLNLRILANSTKSITTPEGEEVSDPRMIMEFYNNADMHIVRAVQDTTLEISKQGRTPDQAFSCGNCGHKYESEMTFDYATFFG